MAGIGEEYRCAVCYGIFERTWSDEEAKAEMEATWNETSDPDIVCDDCFQEVIVWAAIEHPEFFR